MPDDNAHWNRFRKYFLRDSATGFAMDVSRMRFDDAFLESMAGRVARAADAMAALESGAVGNPDENRMVGHYWLRAPELAPTPELRAGIERVQAEVRAFAADVHAGRIAAPGGPFSDVLIIGIGGSALGPQFIADALGSAADPVRVHFFDNTDPDGMDRVLDEIGGRLARTLSVVISKSGGTKETRNGMVEAQLRYKAAGLDFAKHAVAVTGVDSQLDRLAAGEGWVRRFPMEDWVGGRTSVMSAVGLLPAALQGIDTTALLEGAAAMDRLTRGRDLLGNPALLMAAMWYHAGCGRGAKDMVVLPYKDRLMLFSKYLQQLVMESIGKERDLDGNVVNQGIAVYGNKGSTDQHAYVQQLRDGLNNFFVTFIEVRQDRPGPSAEMEPGATSGDFLQGFLRGTRAALTENGRESITLSVPKVGAGEVGQLIALYERAVGFYATLVNLNAYHQPGVEAGKKAAGDVLALQAKVIDALRADRGRRWTAGDLAAALGADPEDVYHCLVHLAATRGDIVSATGAGPAEDSFAAR